MLRQVTTIGVLLLVAAAGQAHELVFVRAAAEPATAIPGAPFWISMTVRNPSNRPVHIPQAYVVEVTPPVGEPFLADHVTTRVAHLPGEYAAATELGPGASRQIDFATGNDLGSGMLFDRRLWTPGRYAIRLMFSDHLMDAQLRSGSADAVAQGALTTPSIELEVMKLSAGDAEAWGEVLKSTHGRGSLLMAPNGAATGEALWKRFPDSAYAPYFMQAAAFGIWRTGGETRAQVVAAINEEIQAKDRTGVLAEQIRLGRLMEAAERALADSNVDAAIRAVENVRGSLEQLSMSQSLHEHTRLKSRRAMQRLPSPESIRTQFGTAAER